jgi:hypothetical protein
LKENNKYQSPTKFTNLLIFKFFFDLLEQIKLNILLLLCSQIFFLKTYFKSKFLYIKSQRENILFSYKIVKIKYNQDNEI